MILAIDFDGVIRNSPEAEEALDDLSRAGHKIIIYTSNDLKFVREWLDNHGLDYDEILKKPLADFYIDDRAIKHVSWKETLKQIGYTE